MLTAIRRRLDRREADRRKKQTRTARVWSNTFIRQIGPHAGGDIINVSAWKDEDKEGQHYRDYFPGAESYAISNFEGWRGVDGEHERIADREYDVDLQADLSPELRGRFDLVLNHTTLEHVFDFAKGFSVCAEMSRDGLLIIVPFIQPLHGPEDGDFWRPSPYTMRRFFKNHGFTILAEDAGPVGGRVRYLAIFGSRNPENWSDFPSRPEADAEKTLRARIS